LPNPAGLSLAGTLRGHVESPRDFGHTLRFPASPVDVCRAVLLHEQERIPLELPLTEGGFSLDMQRLSRFGSQATLRPGRWIVLALDRLGTAWAATSENPVSINYRDEAAGSEYRLRGDHSGLTCSVASLLPVPDRPARAQTIIREGYRRRAAAGQRSRAVVYECFYGRSVGCHPRAIFEELRQRLPDDVEHVFVTQPGFLHPPTGASTAQRWTRRYWELLQTSPLVVANCELHRSFQKAGFQTVVQTWHGTPLKRIGLDIDSPKFRNEAYQDDLAHQVAQWSFMLSPTTDTDEIFRRAFAFDGDLIPSGSPRNDRLVRNDAAERADIRARIGLDSGDTAILFAPTFRDDSHTTAGYRASPQCDLPTLLATLPESTRVLFRAHSNIRTTEIPWDNDRVINVSDYPDAQDLILAGDLLVTDYSSLMFDWALTGKPVTLFAPDLEQYQGVRDFYYDYLEVMPTAPARTPAQLGAALETALNSPSVDLTEIVERFAGRDDGSATDRVIDEILQRVDFE
jgi:CDP-glycerol glycerophosphotransferase